MRLTRVLSGLVFLAGLALIVAIELSTDSGEGSTVSGDSVDRLALVDNGGSGGDGGVSATTAPPAEPSTTVETTVPEPVGPIAPLTGLPTTAEAASRPALMVKIDNHVNARPQTGLDKADIVFDMRAESVTRFAAVYQSQVPDPVGPVRSSRTSDFDILRGLDNPLYASSGGNNYVAGALRSLPIVSLTALNRTEYFRDSSRGAPHNLFVNASDLYALAPDAGPPEPWFSYRGPEEGGPASGVQAEGPVAISFRGSPVVTHEWDPERRGWLRTQSGAPHLTVEGLQLAPTNVVVMITDYSTSPADPISPEVRSTGTGPLVVLTDGLIVSGTWARETPESKPELLDRNGELIALEPGTTWVLLPEAGQVTDAEGRNLPEG